jgi:hypothetical protein
VIVVISDGDDNFSERIREMSIAEARATVKGETTPAASLVALQAKHRRAIEDVQQAVLKADATFYSVNPGGSSLKLNQIAMRAQTGMATVAEASGGTAFIPETDKDLEVVFRQVAAELRGQYLLQYYADPDVPSGSFRRIKGNSSASAGSPGASAARVLREATKAVVRVLPIVRYAFRAACKSQEL